MREVVGALVAGGVRRHVGEHHVGRARRAAPRAARARRIEEIELREVDARRAAPSRGCRSPPPGPCPAAADTRAPPPGSSRRARRRGRRTRAPGFEETVLVVDLDQLEGGARAKAFALGARHIGIVELALEPALRREPCGLLPVHPHLGARSPRSPRVSSGVARPAGASCAPATPRPRASSRPACLRAGRDRRCAGARTGSARRIASRMAQPASTRSARSAPMQGLATRSS